MKVGIITQTNKKGQIVIPKEIRDALGIAANIPLNVVLRGEGIYIYPIREVITDLDTNNNAYLKILEKTLGSWKQDSWKKTEQTRRKIEIRATTKNKKAW